MGKHKLGKYPPIDEDVFIFRSKSRSGRQRIQKIRAPSFELAKEKAILQFSDILYFKQKPMDLVTALARATKASKDAKKSYYVLYDGDDGECSVGTAPLRGATHKFVNGIEDKSFYANHLKTVGEEKPKANSLPAQSEKAKKLIEQKTAKESAEEDSKTKNKKETKMEKVAVKKTSKKGAKKSIPAKKTTSNGESKITRGNNMSLTSADWSKVDKILTRDSISFSAWSRNLVLAKIK